MNKEEKLEEVFNLLTTEWLSTNEIKLKGDIFSHHTSYKRALDKLSKSKRIKTMKIKKVNYWKK